MKWRVLVLLFAFSPVYGQKTATATFAGGCFWCTEEAFEKLSGVSDVVSGYMGGKVKNPSYDQVSTGRTGHTEVVQVTFDPAKVSYEKLLDTFWLNHDPTVKDRQFCDVGSQYRPEIFYHSEEQKRLAEASKAKGEKENGVGPESGRPVWREADRGCVVVTDRKDR